MVADYERAIIERVVAGTERAGDLGGWSGGAHPFGDTSEPKTSFLVPDEHAPLVCVMFDLYGHKRLGARAIANWLNQQGHRTLQRARAIAARPVSRSASPRRYPDWWRRG